MDRKSNRHEAGFFLIIEKILLMMLITWATDINCMVKRKISYGYLLFAGRCLYL